MQYISAVVKYHLEEEDKEEYCVFDMKNEWENCINEGDKISTCDW